jgi:hypothetical protein
VAFRLVIGRVTYKAILLVTDDWQALKVAYTSYKRLYEPLKTYKYELSLRYDLPYVYRLSIYLIIGALINLNLFYRRWHLSSADSALIKPLPSALKGRDYLESSKTITAMHEVL